MKRKILVLVIIFIIMLLCITGIFKMLQSKQDKVIMYALGNEIEYQKQKDEEIKLYMDNLDYTFENPKIILNPYGLTPLTALIIFNTVESTSIQVQVNETIITTVSEDKSHAIPIYGMYADYNNIIKLTDDKGNTVEHTIKTEKYQGDLLQVEVSNEILNDEVYFVSPNFVENCIYDKKGNLLWYIKGDYAGDIEFLDNGHFYISDPYQGSNGVKINYAGFLEMDYLGKIYKQYITPYGYHHEIVQIDEETVLILGAEEESSFLEAVMYTMDLKTGKVKEKIDMYEVLHEISPQWIDSLGEEFDFVLNSAYYDKKTGDAIISCRGIGAIIRINLETSEIKWMFADPNNLPEEFDKYLLKVIDNTKYPYGEHSAFLTKEGYLAFHNNDIDQLNLKSHDLVEYSNNYTTNVALEINEAEKTIQTVWEYEAERKEFSKVAGYLEFLENGNTLINYGWSITENARQNPEGKSIEDTEYLNGVIVELDKDNNILFRAKMTGLIYRVYKTSFYREITENYSVENYKRINGLDVTGEEINTSAIKKEIKNAEDYKEELEIQINRITLSLNANIEDNVDVIFVGENEKSYICNYKESGKEAKKAFNSGKYGKLFSIPEGKYEVYIRINNLYYDTNIIGII